MNKRNVCILFGGVTPEHEVSLRSAECILTNIDRERNNVFAVGCNSLNAVELAVALGVKPQTVYDFPFLTSLAKQLEKEEQRNETRVPGINDLIARTEATPETPHTVKNVLLTGATGFLGVHILKNLIEAGCTVYCLVRDEKRLIDALRYYFGDFTSERIVPVRGNIEEERLGLFPSTYKKLIGEIDTVFHTAANVHHAGDYREVSRTNVVGTKNVIAFCEEADAVLEHTSTVSVHGSATVIERTEKAVFDEHVLDIGQHYTDNVYIHSKYRAEEEVLLARERGLKTNIFRIGNLTWRTTDGKFQKNAADNGFLHRLHAILKLGIYHENFEKFPIDLTAVDECADAYVRLALSGRTNRIWHMFNDHFLDVRDLFDRLGRPWKYASTLEAVERMVANTDDRDIHVYLFYMLIPGYAIALLLTFVVPPIFTAIAFDSGGVASGPMTATFLLPFAMGACMTVGGNVVTDAFGVVTMVAMTPLVAIQCLGLAYKLKSRKVQKPQVQEDTLEGFGDYDIIDL